MIDTLTEGTNVLKLIGHPHVKESPSPPPPLLKVMDLPNRGRGYVATQDIEAGTLIHVSDPLAMVVNQEWMPETCMGCFEFAYPKKMKVKALSTIEETRALVGWWQQQQRKATNTSRPFNTATLAPLRHVAFCTDECKQAYISACSNDEWFTWLTCMYRLEHYSPQQQQQQQQQHNNRNKTNALDYDDLDDPTIILHDDNALRIYLDKVWDGMGEESNAAADRHVDQDDFDDSDRTMCRFIASCLVKRKLGEFEALWTMQDNELGQFRHFYQQQQQQPIEQDMAALSISSSSSTTTTCSSSSSTSTSTSISTAPSIHSIKRARVPLAVKQTMQLYRHFVSAMTQPMTLCIKGDTTVSLPAGLPHQDITSQLFRAIYYREMANSFGLWEQPRQRQRQRQRQPHNSPIEAAATMVTDDLELLGFGIYPSAVYFNHSCLANAVKLRHQSRMQFYTRQHVSQGEEVCISYGNVDAPLAERQQRLLDHYYFTCACTRCRLEQDQEN